MLPPKLLRLILPAVAILACLLWAPRPAAASSLTPITYIVTGDLADGGSLNGFIQLDFLENGSKLPVGWSLTISGSTLPGYSFNPGDSTASVTGDPLFDILQADPVELQWTTNTFGLDDNGIPILGGFYSYNGQSVAILDGQMNPTPEPAAWTLFGAGMVTLLGWAWRNRGDHIAFMHKANN